MKTDNRDAEIPTVNGSRSRGNSLNSFLAGAATVLVLFLAGGAFLLYRAIQSGQVGNPFNPETETTTNPVATSLPEPPTPAADVTNGGEQDTQFVLPALANQGRVELLSVKRLPGTADEVRVQMRFYRTAANAVGSDLINVGETTARDPLTFASYPAVDPETRSSGQISLFEMRPGETKDAYVILNVPSDVDTIDIVVENTGVFKSVPIGGVDRVTDGENVYSLDPPTLPPVPPTAREDNNRAARSTEATPSVSPTISPSPAASISPSPSSTVSPAANNSATRTGSENQSSTTQPIKPGQFVQKAYGSQATVELLSVQRIQDPETGNRDVVNVQMRIRRQAEQLQNPNVIAVGETTARNPQTSETYQGVDGAERSTGPVALSNIRSGASADAYVWLRVPETAKTLNIYVPQTGAFNNVPISE